MKKFFFVAIAAMALTFTSCSKDPVAQDKEYMEQAIKAAEDADYEKLAKVMVEAKKWQEGLKDEDKDAVKEFEKSEEAKKLEEKMMDAMMKLDREKAQEALEKAGYRD